MDYHQIKEVGIITAPLASTDLSPTFPSPYTVPGGYRFYLIVNEEFNRFDPAISDNSKSNWQEETDLESRYTNMLEVLLNGHLVKASSTEKGLVDLVQQYDTREWIKYWSDQNVFGTLGDVVKELGIIDQLPHMMAGGSACVAHVGTCSCGIPSCYSYSVMLIMTYTRELSIPMVFNGSAGAISSIATDLRLFLEKDKEEVAEGRAPFLREMQDNGLFLQPENYFRLPKFF